MLEHLDHYLSIGGALLVLGAYVANLFHWLDSGRAPYAALNTVGSGLLSYVALKSSPVGIILIEVAWTLISLIALIGAVLRRMPATVDPSGPVVAPAQRKWAGKNRRSSQKPSRRRS